MLPVTDNPITNASTVEALKIDSVLVENNVDAAGKDTSDHLEIALTNTGSTVLTGFEVYYTFTFPTTSTTESYYTKLPDSFTIPGEGQRVVHFDNTGAQDYFPVYEFSLYATSLNALGVTVIVSASDAAPKQPPPKRTPEAKRVPTDSVGLGYRTTSIAPRSRATTPRTHGAQNRYLESDLS